MPVLPILAITANLSNFAIILGFEGLKIEDLKSVKWLVACSWKLQLFQFFNFSVFLSLYTTIGIAASQCFYFFDGYMIEISGDCVLQG